MRILKDFKIPDFKFPKFKMKNVENIDEMKVDYEAIEKKQKEGKKRMKSVGSVEVPQEAFMAILSMDDE